MNRRPVLAVVGRFRVLVAATVLAAAALVLLGMPLQLFGAREEAISTVFFAAVLVAGRVLVYPLERLRPLNAASQRGSLHAAWGKHSGRWNLNDDIALCPSSPESDS